MHAAAHRTRPDHAGPDRRRHGRMRCAQVNCRFAGQVQDMSASGLRLTMDRPAPIGRDSSLTLILGSQAGLVEVKARVVWSRAAGSGHELGLAFAEPGPRTRAALFDLVWRGPDQAGPASSLRIAGHA